MKKLKLVAAAVVALAALAAVPALADPPTPQNPAGKLLGVVPVHNQARKGGGGANLVYHNGPVMRTNVAYAIYWSSPQYPIASSYENAIDQYFADVAADSGKTSNVYDSDTQYYDASGAHIAYSSGFGGSYDDTSGFGSNGCRDSYTAVCVSDAQIQAEVQKAMAAKGWTAAPNHLFFVFTAKGVGSCAGSSCAFSYYCAYHSWTGSGSSAVLYANMPYADTVPSACGTTEPNGNEADSTLNVTSHEHNEAITDAQGTAWYDRRGYENGDKCAWNFGSALGSTAYGSYNQLIDGHPYYLQQEWSNARSGCVLQGT
jgi:hypothetical protein